MKYLVKYSVFENTFYSATPRTRTPSQSTVSGIPKIDLDNLEDSTGKKANPKNKGKVENYMSNWFEKIGKGIEKLGGTLIKDPGQWRKDYKSNLAASNSAVGTPIKMADGSTKTVSTDAGFSDIIGGATSLIKGVLEKMFGSPSAPPIDKDNPEITPQHERVFVDRYRGEYEGYRSQEDMDKWIMDNYRMAGFRPGQNRGFDRAMQAAEFDWLGSAGGTAARTAAATEGMAAAGTAAGTAEAGLGLAELAELAIFL